MGIPVRADRCATPRTSRAETPDSGVYAVVRPREETLLAFAAHDVKNMLGVLTSNVEFLREAVRTNADTSTVEEALDDLEACAVRLKDIMQQALEPKAAASVLKPQKAPVNVASVLQAVYQQMRHNAAAADVGLEVKITTDAVALIDRALIERVLCNLVDNALRFSPRGTVVRIGCGVSDERVELTVTDQGPGVDRGNCDRIFEPYFTTSAGSFPGESPHSGLGLAFCRTVARCHRGDVRAESTPNGGRFVVDLPLAP